MRDFLQKAKQSSRIIGTLGTAMKNNILLQMADELINSTFMILEANNLDMQVAKEMNLSSAMQDRLFLNEKRVCDMANAIRQIASQTEPVGRILDGCRGIQRRGPSLPFLSA